jgi:secreted trypsin-like serine protease
MRFLAHMTTMILAATLVVTGSGVAEAVVNPDRDVNGYEADWTALIELTEDGERYVVCSGSLIAPDIVVTAAHCTYGLTSFSTVVVRFAVEGDRAAITRQVAGVVHHGKYIRQESLYEVDEDGEIVEEIPGDVRAGENGYDADIALIALSSPVRSIKPVSLAKQGYRPKSGWRVFGYGATGPGEDESPYRVLTAAQVDMTRQVRAELVGPYTRVLGAGGDNSGTCYGDSGGPLVDGRGVLIGLTSFGLDEACITDKATVFTRVSAFSDWISRAKRLTRTMALSDPKTLSGSSIRNSWSIALE